MSSMQGISGAGSMPRNCGMPGMHENSKVNKQNVPIDAQTQAKPKEEKIPNQILGNKFDAKI